MVAAFETRAALLVLICMVFIAGCGGGGGDGDGDANEARQFAFRDQQEPNDVLDTGLLRTFVGANQVNCTLSNGFKTQCWELVFAANPIADGPFCPPTTATTGGYGIYDGTTNTGLRVVNAALFADMELDGFDITDDVGNVRILDPGDPDNVVNTLLSFCQQATPDDALQLTFLIPVRPLPVEVASTMAPEEVLGVSLDGIPYTGSPFSTVVGPDEMPNPLGTAQLPALGPCGAHHDGAGYLHAHFVTESIEAMYTANSIDPGNTCTDIAQNDAALTGFAKDGYPIYGILDANGSTPVALDACNGHAGTTNEYPAGVYHYHASTDIPSVPPCLTGAFVANGLNFSFE